MDSHWVPTHEPHRTHRFRSPRGCVFPLSVILFLRDSLCGAVRFRGNFQAYRRLCRRLFGSQPTNIGPVVPNHTGLVAIGSRQRLTRGNGCGDFRGGLYVLRALGLPVADIAVIPREPGLLTIGSRQWLCRGNGHEQSLLKERLCSPEQHWPYLIKLRALPEHHSTWPKFRSSTGPSYPQPLPRLPQAYRSHIGEGFALTGPLAVFVAGFGTGFASSAYAGRVAANPIAASSRT